MTDMLIKLYDLPEGPAEPTAAGLSARLVRKPIGPEHDAVVAWVRQTFGDRWASEARVALHNRPVSLFIAMQDGDLIGFACYDATAKGLVGPIGVREAERRSGIGAALLRAALTDMRAAGYGYAIAGSVGPGDFFSRVAGATAIAGSTPGLYAGLFKGKGDD